MFEGRRRARRQFEGGSCPANLPCLSSLPGSGVNATANEAFLDEMADLDEEEMAAEPQ